MIREYRYAGPDGDGIGSLPPGTGAAVGSDYCVHLLPGREALERAVCAVGARGIPLVLLTPYFRDRELKAALPLFRAIPDGADVTVAVNDWGLLLTLRVLFPGIAPTVGRLLSGQKRCPRIEGSPRLTAEGRAWHRHGLFSSERGRRFLRAELGVRGYHADRLGTDPVPGPFPADPQARDGGADILFVHEPYAIVTVSDACPWLGGRSSAAVASCPRPCRNGAVRLAEPSMGRDLVQKGKARFVRAARSVAGETPGDDRVRTILYDEIP